MWHTAETCTSSVKRVGSSNYVLKRTAEREQKKTQSGFDKIPSPHFHKTIEAKVLGHDLKNLESEPRNNRHCRLWDTDLCRKRTKKKNWRHHSLMQMLPVLWSSHTWWVPHIHISAMWSVITVLLLILVCQDNATCNKFAQTWNMRWHKPQTGSWQL